MHALSAQQTAPWALPNNPCFIMLTKMAPNEKDLDKFVKYPMKRDLHIDCLLKNAL